MNDQMQAALASYAEGGALLREVVESFGVSRSMLAEHIRRQGLNRKRGVKGHGKGTYRGPLPYILTYAPDHPWPRKSGLILEHVRLTELEIGRRLAPSECVHHDDLNPRNNERSNRILMTKRAHSQLHAQLRRAAMKER